MNNKIRLAKEKDSGAITDVLRTTWLATYPNPATGITRKDIEQEPFGHRPDGMYSRTWVVEADKIVGVCRAFSYPNAQIKYLYVLPDYQSLGIGSALIKKALQWLPKEVEVSVASYNQKAIAFYERFGFTEVGKEPDFQLISGKSIPQLKFIRNSL